MKLNIPYDELRNWLDLAGEVGEVSGVEGPRISGGPVKPGSTEQLAPEMGR
jgi:hypothetical protein